ncbi:MAG TPA: group 1 truncated hemoglobin [Gemmataceae bacterium]|jgi:hemoglobin
MQSATRSKNALSAFVGVLLLVGAASAQEEKSAGKPLERAALDESIYRTLRGIIDHGADLYNQGDWTGCYRLWEGTLMTLKPLVGDRQIKSWTKTGINDNTVYADALKGLQSQLGDRPALKNVIESALATAQQTPQIYRRPFILRVVLDQLRAETRPARATAAKENKSSGTSEAKKILWDRLGGEPGVTKIVDDFVNLAAADPKVDFFRRGKFQMAPDQVVKMKHELVEQISQATGGPLKYTGRDMKKVHKGMGITEAQFDAAAADLKKALEMNKVAPDDVKKILDAVASYRQEIVEPKKTEEKKPAEKKEEKKEGKEAEDTARIEGKVTYQGKPVAGGTITFAAKSGLAFSGVLAADGSYVLRVKPGEYKVAIDTKAKIPQVPAKYADPDKSGLTITIQERKQTYDIALQ